ncbi:hypothetical protein [Vibrio owensii]|uniref:hypothetical protein n=1 Tax=Vibrio owensii TaxID=696485 RepID=UPI0022DE6102|nr:hypothetical protein [Vibrio owensii]MDA0385806.1 hypothetical protein [Vibrio owensii]
MSISDRVEVLKSHWKCSSKSEQELLEYSYHTLVNQDFMPLYVSSTETFITLAITAIGLSVAFREKILGQSGKLELTPLLVSSWSMLGATIASGAYYLYAAPKHIELRYQCDYFTPFNIWPAYAYGACTITLIFGLCLLFVLMVKQARQNA